MKVDAKFTFIFYIKRFYEKTSWLAPGGKTFIRDGREAAPRLRRLHRSRSCSGLHLLLWDVQGLRRG